MKKVLAFGTFDTIHPGHVFFLTEAKKLGDYLTVVVARDVTVAAVKNHHPRRKETLRKYAVEALHIADKVILGGLDDKYKVIFTEAPNVIALGYDQVVFTEKLPSIVSPDVAIIRIDSFEPEKYKSSKLRNTHA